MLYEGYETYIFFKDNEEDMKEYKNINIEQFKTQGFLIFEDKKTIKLKRIFRLNRPLPVLDAEYKIIDKEKLTYDIIVSYDIKVIILTIFNFFLFIFIDYYNNIFFVY